MDGIHLLGEWYGCPADTPEMTRAARAARSVRAPGRSLRADRRRRQLPPVRAAGRHRHGAARRIASRDPHLARTRLRHGRRLRLQLHDRQHGQGRTAVPRDAGRAAAAAHEIPGDPSRRDAMPEEEAAARPCARRADRVSDRRLRASSSARRASSSSSSRRSRRSRCTTPRRSASCSASTATS